MDRLENMERRLEDLLVAAKGCLGYFDYMRAQGSEFTPDERWLKPLREAIERAEAKGASDKNRVG